MIKILALALSLILAPPVFAALDFNGTTDKILATTAVVTASPMTMCAWAMIDAVTADRAIGSISDTGSGTSFFTLIFKNTGDLAEWWANSTAAGAGESVSSTTIAAAAWRLLCGAELAINSRAVWLDGGSKGTNVTSVTPTSIDATAIGVRKRSTEDMFWDGKIASFAIWNRALSDAEVLSLSKGFSPNCFKNGLVLHTDLVRDIKDDFGTVITAWTATGTTVAAHPRIIYCH